VGRGCALGDVAGEWVVFAGSITIAGAALWPGYVLDYAIAYVLGILFQYLAIKPMSDLSRRAALRRAIQADTLSIVAFELGMFAWMALVYFVLFTHPHLSADDAAFWLMMQLAMAIGLLTTYPTNAWLVRRGVKHPMGRPTLRAAAAGAATSRERVA
jgi:putative flippase GtrA